MTLAIALGSFLLGCTAGVFGMICVAPLLDVNENPADIDWENAA